MAPRQQQAGYELGGVGVAQPGSAGFDSWAVAGERYVRGLLRSSGNSGEQLNGVGPLQQIRVHPGIIAAVVVVALLALLAAIFIIKKYCFSESNITYRYSVLRSNQEELDNSTTNRLQDDSDEDMLE